MSQMYPLHALSFCCLNVDAYVIFLCVCVGVQSGFCHLVCHTDTPWTFLCFPMRATCPANFVLFGLITRIIFGKWNRWCRILLCNFPPLFLYFALPFRSRYFVTPWSQTLQSVTVRFFSFLFQWTCLLTWLTDSVRILWQTSTGVFEDLKCWSSAPFYSYRFSSAWLLEFFHYLVIYIFSNFREPFQTHWQ
jgi:hypothetical protein